MFAVHAPTCLTAKQNSNNTRVHEIQGSLPPEFAEPGRYKGFNPVGTSRNSSTEVNTGQEQTVQSSVSGKVAGEYPS